MLKISKKLLDIRFNMNIIYIKQRRFGWNPERHFFWGGGYEKTYNCNNCKRVRGRRA